MLTPKSASGAALAAAAALLFSVGSFTPAAAADEAKVHCDGVISSGVASNQAGGSLQRVSVETGLRHVLPRKPKSKPRRESRKPFRTSVEYPALDGFIQSGGDQNPQTQHQEAEYLFSVLAKAQETASHGHHARTRERTKQYQWRRRADAENQHQESNLGEIASLTS